MEGMVLNKGTGRKDYKRFGDHQTDRTVRNGRNKQ